MVSGAPFASHKMVSPRRREHYISLYAEAPHFAHLHIHIVPRAADLPEDVRGPRVFGLLTADGAVPPDEIQRLSEELRARFPA